MQESRQIRELPGYGGMIRETRRLQALFKATRTRGNNPGVSSSSGRDADATPNIFLVEPIMKTSSMDRIR
jgi:hypothetical protein